MNNNNLNTLIVIVGIICIGSYGIAESVREYRTDMKAMENGYSQVIENGVILWKKDNEID